MKLRLLLLQLLLGLPANLSAEVKPVLTCTHPEACRMAQATLVNPHTFHFKIAIKILGDAHHFDPSPQQIKAMLKAEKLIMAPLSQQPWSQLIELKRKREATLRLASPTIPTAYRHQLNRAAWDHFWLNPFTYCEVFQTLAKSLNRWYPHIKTKNCPFSSSTLKTLLEKPKVSQLFILTHDSLAPLMLALKKNYLTLKGSHHGEELSPQTLKKLSRELKKYKKIIWLKENHLPFPPSLHHYTQRKNTKIIELYTLKPFPSKGDPPLNDILNTLGSKN